MFLKIINSCNKTITPGANHGKIMVQTVQKFVGKLFSSNDTQMVTTLCRE